MQLYTTYVAILEVRSECFFGIALQDALNTKDKDNKRMAIRNAEQSVAGQRYFVSGETPDRQSRRQNLTHVSKQ